MTDKCQGKSMECPTCRNVLVRKNRLVLICVGSVMVASILSGFLNLWLLIPSVPLAVIGSYLIVWGTVGAGLWCRTCKKFPIM